jgi:hypothetical protein
MSRGSKIWRRLLDTEDLDEDARLKIASKASRSLSEESNTASAAAAVMVDRSQKFYVSDIVKVRPRGFDGAVGLWVYDVWQVVNEGGGLGQGVVCRSSATVPHISVVCFGRGCACNSSNYCAALRHPWAAASCSSSTNAAPQLL